MSTQINRFINKAKMRVLSYKHGAKLAQINDTTKDFD